MKIVSLSPSLTEILEALKISDTLVSLSSKANFLREIETTAPEWVLVDSQESRPEEVEVLRRRWKTKLFQVKTLEGVLDCAAELGRLVGKRKESQELNEAIQGEIQRNQEIFRDRERKRTILLLWNQPYLTVNFDTYASRLLEASGGINVFREEPLREFPVEVEDMIEKNPAFLLLSSDPAPFQARHVDEFRRYRIFSQIPIHLVDGKLFSGYGPRTIQALRDLRGIYCDF